MFAKEGKKMKVETIPPVLPVPIEGKVRSGIKLLEKDAVTLDTKSDQRRQERNGYQEFFRKKRELKRG